MFYEASLFLLPLLVYPFSHGGGSAGSSAGQRPLRSQPVDTQLFALQGV